MGTITNKLTYLQETKTAIKNAIVSKGVSVSDNDTFRSYADKISSITTGEGGSSSDEWQPQSDWWDIDTILEEDTEDYPAKMIVLVTDGSESSTFNYDANCKTSLLKTSDGSTYTYDQKITHTWDTSKDKECSLGYKTRYYIVYFSQSEMSFYYNSFLSLTKNDVNSSNLYIIMENMVVNSVTSSGANFFNSNKLFERLKQNNSTLTTQSHAFSGCPSLVQIDQMTSENGFFNFNGCSRLKKIGSITFGKANKVLNYTYYGCSSMEEYNFEDTSNITTFQNLFNGSINLKRINKLDFSSVTNISGMFNNCPLLQCIDEVSNIGISAITLSGSTLLQHDTIIRIFNALVDVSSDTENRYRLTLGTTNLAKLTDEEKAIATNKGWTLN